MKRALISTFCFCLIVSCSSDKKQRDTRNLTWYEINMDARNKHVKVGIHKDFIELKQYVLNALDSTLMAKMNISVDVSTYDSVPDLDVFDITIDDLPTMLNLKAQDKLLKPIFTKLAFAEREMKKNSEYRKWIDITENHFVPFVYFEPIYEQNESMISSINKNLSLILAFKTVQDKEQLKSSSNLNRLFADSILNNVKQELRNVQKGSIKHQKQGSENLNNPLYIAVSKTSKVKAASLVIANLLLEGFLFNEAFMSISNHPEIQASFHKDWYLAIEQLRK